MKKESKGERAEAAVLEPRYLSVRQCATYIGRTDKAVYHLVREGRIPHRKLPGGRLVFDRVALDRWVARAPGVSVNEAIAWASRLPSGV